MVDAAFDLFQFVAALLGATVVLILWVIIIYVIVAEIAGAYQEYKNGGKDGSSSDDQGSGEDRRR